MGELDVVTAKNEWIAEIFAYTCLNCRSIFAECSPFNFFEIICCFRQNVSYCVPCHMLQAGLGSLLASMQSSILQIKLT